MSPASPPTPSVALLLALLLAVAAPRAADQAQFTGTGDDASRPGPQPGPSMSRDPRRIFVCRAADGTVFSDRPCGAVIKQREVAPEASAGKAPSTIPRPASATPLRRPGFAAEEQHGDTDDRGCRRLRDRLERLDDRMRAGYSGRESARLWQQRRELKEQIRRRRC